MLPGDFYCDVNPASLTAASNVNREKENHPESQEKLSDGQR